MLQLNEEGNLIHGWLTVKVLRVSQGATKWEILAEKKPNVLTLNGRDEFINQSYIYTAATNRGSNFIGVTSNAGAPATSDTILTGEITTNGLQRAVCVVISHSAGTNAITLGHTYTASGVHTAVQKAALFNASSGGTMSHITTFGSTDLASPDQLQLTWNLTLG